MEAFLLLALMGEPSEKAVPLVTKALVAAPDPVISTLGYKAGVVDRITNTRSFSPIVG